MPYHKYVFNNKGKKFVGEFEEMYRNEDLEGYDSWYSSNLMHIPKLIHYQILNSYNFSRILDFGCGKGAFTHLLKKRNNYVLGLDISFTAIAKANNLYGNKVDFKVINNNDFSPFIKEKFDCTIVLETLSYIENWDKVISDISTFSEYLYISLFIPPEAIGFVKSQDSLVQHVQKYFRILEKIIYNEENIFILGKNKSED